MSVSNLRAVATGQVVVGLRLTLTERASGKLLAQEILHGDAAVRGNNFSAVTLAYRQVLMDFCGGILARVHTLRISDG